jgi:predicted ATPase
MVFEDHLKALSGTLDRRTAAYFNYMDSKFMILNEETYSYACRLNPERLDVYVGTPDNVDASFTRNVFLWGERGTGKTALIDCLRFGKIQGSPS